MIVYGFHPVLNFVKHKPELIKEIFICRDISSDLVSKFKYKLIKRHELDNLTNSREHQGIACKISYFPFVDFDNYFSKVNTILILDHIEDPRNLGAILRNAAAFGIELVVIPKDRASDITPVVIKTSAGAAAIINISKVTNINNCIRTLKEHFFSIYGLEADGKKELSQITFDKNAVLILGSEGKGLSQLTKKLCDYIIRIDISEKASSLNVASASAITLYKMHKDFKSK